MCWDDVYKKVQIYSRTAERTGTVATQVFLRKAKQKIEIAGSLSIYRYDKFKLGIERDFALLDSKLKYFDSRLSGANSKEFEAWAEEFYNLVTNLIECHAMATSALVNKGDQASGVVDGETKSWILTVVLLAVSLISSVLIGGFSSSGVIDVIVSKGWIKSTDTLYYYVQAVVQLISMIITLLICFCIRVSYLKKKPNFSQAMRLKYPRGFFNSLTNAPQPSIPEDFICLQNQNKAVASDHSVATVGQRNITINIHDGR